MDFLLLLQDKLRHQVDHLSSEQRLLKQKKQEMESQIYQEKGSLRNYSDRYIKIFFLCKMGKMMHLLLSIYLVDFH